LGDGKVCQKKNTIPLTVKILMFGKEKENLPYRARIQSKGKVRSGHAPRKEVPREGGGSTLLQRRGKARKIVEFGARLGGKGRETLQAIQREKTGAPPSHNVDCQRMEDRVEKGRGRFTQGRKGTQGQAILRRGKEKEKTQEKERAAFRRGT